MTRITVKRIDAVSEDGRYFHGLGLGFSHLSSRRRPVRWVSPLPMCACTSTKIRPI